MQNNVIKIRVMALLGLAALTTACTALESNTLTAQQNATQEATSGELEQEANSPTPEVVEWDGRWSGVIPCASCPGIEVALILNNDATFLMREEYQEEKDSIFVSEGTVSWDEATRVLTLKFDDREQKIRFEGEGEAFYLDENNQPQPDYRLTKQAEYRAPGQQLILPLQRVRVEDEKVFFDGLLNYKEVQKGGFKSVKGETVIDCAKNQVYFKDATYYPETDAIGDRITNVSHMVKGGFKLGSNADEDVMSQVAETFCPNK